MKAKQKNELREHNYYSYLLTCLTSIFKWELPETVSERWISRYLTETGSFAVKKKDDGYTVIAHPSRAGTLDQYGDGDTVVGATRNGISFSGIINKDCLICYNNSDRTPDFDIMMFADRFSEIDKSIEANIRWTILAPVLCASDSKTASAINLLVNDMLEGKLKCITSRDVLDSLTGGNGNNLYSVDITHPDRIKNVQYQSELFDVLTRRFFNKYGLNIQNSSKHAQVSTDEVHGLDSVAWVFVLDMLRERQKFCEEATKMFGGTWKCEFSDIWQIEYEAYLSRTLEVQEPKQEEQEEQEEPKQEEQEETKDDDVE